VSSAQQVRAGMQVHGADDRSLGTVERLEEGAFTAGGRRFPLSAVARVAKNRVYLKEEGARSPAAAGEAIADDAATIRVPVVEERLEVETRETELGEVRIRRTVEQEQVAVPVELRREEVHVEERDIADRPLSAAEADAAFQEGTVRVPVYGEEAVVTKEAVVTGEVVLDKEQVVERQQISDTVRRQHVEVEEHFQRDRPDFEQHFQRHHAAWGGRPASFAEAEPHYRTGYEVGRDERYAALSFEDLEPELRERFGHGPQERASEWEHMRERIREGWQRARRA
jgi:uncharacterized protein (TIGR02271 family)